MKHPLSIIIYPLSIILYPLSIILSVLLLTACHSDEGDWSDDDEVENRVSLSIVGTDGQASTVLAGTNVGLYVVGNANYTNRILTVGSDGQVVLPAEGVTGQIVLYMPYQSSWTGDVAEPKPFTVRSDQSADGAYEASDLMVGVVSTTAAARTRSEGGDAANASFRHLLSKVMVNIIDETGKMELNKIGVRLLDFDNSVLVNLLQQSCTTVSNSKDDITALPGEVTDRRLSAIAVVAPQQLTTTRQTIELQIRNSIQRFSLPADAALNSGETYSFNMRYTAVGMIVDGSSIADWEEDDSDNILKIRTKKTK